MVRKALLTGLILIGMAGLQGCNEPSIRTSESPTAATVNNSQLTDLQKPVLANPQEPIVWVDGKKNNVVLAWTGNAQHYDLMVRNPNETRVSYISSNLTGKTVTEAFLPSEKPYTWWIRAYATELPFENFIDSEFSQFIINKDAKNQEPFIKTLTYVVLPAELISPTEGISDSPKNVIFTFAWIGNGKKYDLMIKKPNDTDFNVAYSSPSSLPYETEMKGSALGTYNWKIRSYDDKGNYVDSEIRSYTFGQSS